MYTYLYQYSGLNEDLVMLGWRKSLSRKAGFQSLERKPRRAKSVHDRPANFERELCVSSPTLLHRIRTYSAEPSLQDDAFFELFKHSEVGIEVVLQLYFMT